jgi:peptidoglycan-associated lipoprotein
MRVQGVVKTVMLCVMLGTLLGCNTKRGGSAAGSDWGAEDNMRFYGSELSPEQEKALLTHRVYYFDYDSYSVRPEDLQAIAAHAKRLVQASRKHVRVEGHTDNRGSAEYNIALGERRARAVADSLLLKGVPQAQISIVSYGKEKPAVVGDDESAWSQNRRVVLVYELE